MFDQIFVTLRDEKIDTNSKRRDRFSNWNSQSDPYSISERNPNFPPPLAFPAIKGVLGFFVTNQNDFFIFQEGGRTHIISVEVQASVCV